MNPHALQELIADLAEAFALPGVVAGVWRAGKESIACHGVTSIENPLPVDKHTLFQAGSIGKTLTATAVVRLAEAGHVDLDAPVHRYGPGFRLADSAATAQVTLLQLPNHTAGWEGDFFPDRGGGDLQGVPPMEFSKAFRGREQDFLTICRLSMRRVPCSRPSWRQRSGHFLMRSANMACTSGDRVGAAGSTNCMYPTCDVDRQEKLPCSSWMNVWRRTAWQWERGMAVW
ncbi:serine hydrolase [Ectothiorhodospira sp. BSL-9]|uniref:serine hydrolase domain-containing protein n=1 Tax=Ectothiorhodospira sp. BSL-9 TaxID=1442136 RepID=UPI0009ED200F|nr:serine hydrolase domain-containing protein [Ectothiorhodospira sp. BSL-9]